MQHNFAIKSAAAMNPQTVLFGLTLNELIKKTLIAFAIGLIFSMLPEIALAQSQGGPAPWDAGLCKWTKAMTGPWVGWVAIIAIVGAAVLYAVGENNQTFQTAMRIVAGFSVALGAVAAASWFFPGQIQALSC